MAKRLTSKIANSDLLNGKKLYLERAKKTLPFLVRQAIAGQTIYYSDLATEVAIPNPRNLNYVLGAIGNALLKLGKKIKIEIPPIQCLVINKRNKIPGEGIGWFISPKDFSKLNISQKRAIVKAQLSKIFAFQKWDMVLQQLGLEPIHTKLNKEVFKAKNYKEGGESEQHKNFKEFIAKNPAVLGLSKDVGLGQIEYELPSKDSIDVVFNYKGLRIGVEVKSSISDTTDILRGIFQCVKYKYLIEAEQVIADEIPNSRVILALQGQLPKELIIAKNLLGIDTVENIKGKI